MYRVDCVFSKYIFEHYYRWSLKDVHRLMDILSYFYPKALVSYKRIKCKSFDKF